MALKIWETKRSFLGAALVPFSWLYSVGATFDRLSKYPQRVNVPVICLGNLTVGGSGKTPAALSLGAILQKHGYKPFFLTRGYKGKIKGVVVDKSLHTAKDVGDEAMLLADTAPTVVNPNRFQGAETAIAAGADIIIMDDGFQNYGLYKDKSLLVFDGSYGLGNGRVLPAGPLRESLSHGLKRASGIDIVGEDTSGIAEQIKAINPYLPFFACIVIPDEEVISTLKDKKVIAFAGIGRPDKFFAMLDRYGVNIIAKQAFPDHYAYQDADIKALKEQAAASDAVLVTTDKDKVKLSSLVKEDIISVPVKLSWQNEAQLLDFLMSHE